MPDYEIRYFHADGRLAVIYVSNHASRREAEDYASRNLQDHARFEIRAGDGSLLEAAG